MACGDVCSIKRDLCSLHEVEGKLNNTTSVQVIVDEFMNLSIIDDDNELGAIYSPSHGNFSGEGTKAPHFYLTQMKNFKFIP